MNRTYNPNRHRDWNYGGSKWRLSRSKIEYFIECPRCFYIDNRLGTKRPDIPAFNLNIAVDELLKKEFDIYRAKGERHPIMVECKVDAVPFVHPKLAEWRENFVGLSAKHKPTGFTVSGAVDDVWETPAGELIVVDYKATAKAGKIESLSDSTWEKQYRRQIGVYQWLLKQNGFTVNDTGYFVYANALKTEPVFKDSLIFDTTLIACQGDNDWLEETLREIKTCLEADTYPSPGANCDYCPYRQSAGEKLQAIYKHKQKM